MNRSLGKNTEVEKRDLGGGTADNILDHDTAAKKSKLSDIASEILPDDNNDEEELSSLLFARALAAMGNKGVEGGSKNNQTNAASESNKAEMNAGGCKCQSNRSSFELSAVRKPALSSHATSVVAMTELKAALASIDRKLDHLAGKMGELTAKVDHLTLKQAHMECASYGHLPDVTTTHKVTGPDASRSCLREVIDALDNGLSLLDLCSDNRSGSDKSASPQSSLGSSPDEGFYGKRRNNSESSKTCGTLPIKKRMFADE